MRRGSCVNPFGKHLAVCAFTYSCVNLERDTVGDVILTSDTAFTLDLELVQDLLIQALLLFGDSARQLHSISLGT